MAGGIVVNCKPGDLARVIDTPGTRLVGCVDRILRVTSQLWLPGRPVPAWFYEGPMIICACGCGNFVGSISDEVLRPIRDPGPDAVDETLVGNPAPVRDEVTS